MFVSKWDSHIQSLTMVYDFFPDKSLMVKGTSVFTQHWFFKAMQTALITWDSCLNRTSFVSAYCISCVLCTFIVNDSVKKGFVQFGCLQHGTPNTDNYSWYRCPSESKQSCGTDAVSSESTPGRPCGKPGPQAQWGVNPWPPHWPPQHWGWVLHKWESRSCEGGGWLHSHVVYQWALSQLSYVFFIYCLNRWCLPDAWMQTAFLRQHRPKQIVVKRLRWWYLWSDRMFFFFLRC